VVPYFPEPLPLPCHGRFWLFCSWPLCPPCDFAFSAAFFLSASAFFMASEFCLLAGFDILSVVGLCEAQCN
jgi:hypothetical protein